MFMMMMMMMKKECVEVNLIRILHLLLCTLKQINTRHPTLSVVVDTPQWGSRVHLIFILAVDVHENKQIDPIYIYRINCPI